MSFLESLIDLLKPKNIVVLKPGRRPGSKNKRYPKRDIVQQWRSANPDGSQRSCARETGLSRATVSKWWDSQQKDFRG